MKQLKDLFLLDPTIHFLNHGSFGACPRPVFEVYQAWQQELERQPVAFLGRRSTELMVDARTKLATFLGTDPDEVVYFPNPTTAMNMVARNLALQPGEEILTTDHEYGAMNRTWRFICRKAGARYIQQPIPLPIADPSDFVERFWAGVNPRTKAVFISHITSSTAQLFPVAEICCRARRAGILSLVDGAHAPGQIPLNLRELGADIYTGACHKWLCSPKGAAFLYARREVQHRLDPLVVSWGYESELPGSSQFIDYHEWQGTRDLAAFLSVPAAIRFQAGHDWDTVRRECHTLLVETLCRISTLTGLGPVYPELGASPSGVGQDGILSYMPPQMGIAELPTATDIIALQIRLYDEFRVEVPLIDWNERKLVRVSVQGYNTQEDMDSLVEGLAVLL